MSPPSVLAQSTDPNRALSRQRNQQYPLYAWYAIGAFIGLVTVCHFINLAILWRRRSRGAQPPRVRSQLEKEAASECTASTHSRPLAWRRLPLAILNTYRIVAFRTTLSIGQNYTVNLAEVVLVSAYIILLYVLTFINCDNIVTGVKLDYSYWANRAAIMSVSQFTLIVALGMKNNVISFLTGVAYEKLLVLHRIIARVVFVLLWVHASGRLYSQSLTKGPFLDQTFVRMGIMAITAFSLLFLVSIRPVRHQSYEIFFYVHFFCVLIVLLGAYFHMHLGFGNLSYIYPAFVLWAFDRTVRFGRVLYFCIAVRYKVSAEAEVEVLSDTVVRVTAQRRGAWRAGQNMFLMMPGVTWWPLETHPFTIASIHRQLPMDKNQHVADDGQAADQKLMFIIKCRQGFTRKLKKAADKHGGTVREKIFFDGPYGSPPLLSAFSTVILIAGGSGITYTMSLLLDLVYHVRAGNSSCNRVLFIWSVRDKAILSALSPMLLAALEAAPENFSIEIRLALTQQPIVADSEKPTSRSSSETLSTDNDELSMVLSHRSVKSSCGRPPLLELLDDEISLSTGPVAVEVSGPSCLAQSVRTILQGQVAGPMSILRGRPSVTLHVATYELA